MKNSHEINLAGNLKRILAQKKITVSVAAKEVGMNKSTLHGYCNGVVPRHLLKIRDLANFLDVSLMELIFGEDWAVPSNLDLMEEQRFEISVRRLPLEVRASTKREKQ